MVQTSIMAYKEGKFQKRLTFFSVSTALALFTTGARLSALEENRIIEIAKVTSDLRREAGNSPAIKTVIMQ